MTKTIGFNAAFGGYVIGSILVAFAVPGERLDSSILTFITQSGMAVFPALRAMSEISVIPAATATFYSIQWLLVLPLCWILMNRVSGFRPVRAGAAMVFLGTIVMTLLLAALLYIFGFQTSVRIPPASGRVSFFMNAMVNERLGMGLFGSICFFVMALSVALTVRALKSVLKSGENNG